MLFSSLTFIFAFLPLVIFSYYIVKNRTYRNVVLLISSLLFYSWGEPKTIVLMLITIVVNYFLAIKIDERKRAKFYLVLDCIFNLGILFFFKYFNFFIKDILMQKDFFFTVVLPIGISFYTFQVLSYVIDVYRGKVKAQHNIIKLGTYVSMFPQLIAGPIVRYQTIEHELDNRHENINDFANGLRRFIIGLGKKIIIANQMAIIADAIFVNTPIGELNTMLAWLGAITFALQIYYDFSGYSDMAIGLGKMFGFSFNENFNYPYISKSITEFWRRWHMSLSSWFKDYVYIPLKGSHCSKPRWILNIFIVWSLTGLWHGAAYNFVLWGLYFGIILVLEKLLFKKYLDKLPILNWLITMFVVLIGWIIFNSNSIEQIIAFTRNLIGFNGQFDLALLNNKGLLYLWPYLIIAIIGIGPWINKLIAKVQSKKATSWLVDIYLVAVLVLCITFLINSSYNPFIYFRF